MNMNTCRNVVIISRDWVLDDTCLFAWQLASVLRESGYAVSLVTDISKYNEAHAPLPFPEDARLIRLDLGPSPDFTAILEAYGRCLMNAVPCIMFSIQDYEASALSAIVPASILCIHVVHNSFSVYRLKAMQLDRFTNSLVVCSEFSAKQLRLRRHIASRLHIIRPAAPNAWARREPNVDVDAPLRVVYAGPMYDWHKGTLALAPIISRAIELGANLVCTVVGKCINSYQERLHTESLSGLIAAGRVEWLHTTDLKVMEESLRHGDVFLLPSKHEVFPALLPTAMVGGCVPVAFDIPSGVSELVIDNETGFVVPIGDVEAAANRLVQLCKDRALLRKLFCSLRKHVWESGCSRDFVASQIVEMIEGVVEDQRSNRVFRRPAGLIAPPREAGKPFRDGRPRTSAERKLALIVNGRLDPAALRAATLPPGDGVLSGLEVSKRLGLLAVADALRRLGLTRKGRGVTP